MGRGVGAGGGDGPGGSNCCISTSFPSDESFVRRRVRIIGTEVVRTLPGSCGATTACPFPLFGGFVCPCVPYYLHEERLGHMKKQHAFGGIRINSLRGDRVRESLTRVFECSPHQGSEHSFRLGKKCALIQAGKGCLASKTQINGEKRKYIFTYGYSTLVGSPQCADYSLNTIAGHR